MAHAIFDFEATRRGRLVNVLSAGVWSGFDGELAAEEARIICDRHGTPMPKVVSTHIATEDLAAATRVFVMEHSHVSALATDFGISPERISLLGEFDPQRRGLEIDDPIGQDIAAFERCYARLRDCIVHYLETTDDFGPAT